MINKKTIVTVIDFIIGVVIGFNVIYFIKDQKALFEGSNKGVLIVFIASLATLLLCRFSLLRSISKEKN